MGSLWVLPLADCLHVQSRILAMGNLFVPPTPPEACLHVQTGIQGWVTFVTRLFHLQIAYMYIE